MYKIDIPDKVIEHIMSASNEDVKQTLDFVDNLREVQANEMGTTKDMSLRLLCELPASVYYYLLQKYPKEVLNSKKFWHEFVDVYKAFKVPNKI